MIDQLFNALNFGILLGLMGYVAQRYGLTALRAKIRKKRHTVHELARERNEVGLLQQDLDRRVNEQAQLYEDLRTKVLRWRLNYERQLSQEQEKQKIAQAHIERKHELQAENLELHILERTIIPQALVYAEQELRMLFNDQKVGKAYNHALLEKLKE